MKTSARVLVVKLSSLGDLFHALPAVDQLRRHFDLEVDWVTNRGYVDLVRCFDGVRRVIPFPRQSFWSHAGAFLRDLRRDAYDVILDMQGLQKSAWVAGMARGNLRIGPSFHREGSRWLYHEVAGPRDKQRHAVEECLDFVRHLHVPVAPVTFPVTFPRPEEVLPEPVNIGLLPRSRWETKNWPIESFAELARGLMHVRNASVYVFGAPEDQPECDRLAELAPGCMNRCGQTRLPELGGYLARMDLVVCVDSGPMHMAAAAGTKVLALFGATEAARTGPYGDQHRVMTHDVPCRPCLSRTCQRPERDLRCLTGLTPDVVLHEALGLLPKAHG